MPNYLATKKYYQYKVIPLVRNSLSQCKRMFSKIDVTNIEVTIAHIYSGKQAENELSIVPLYKSDFLLDKFPVYYPKEISLQRYFRIQ